MSVEVAKFTVEEFAKLFRGVETPCEMCRGLGIRMYGATSTWRGGMGCAAMTHDVCDACWGSGDSVYPGVDLRKLSREEEHLVSVRAATLLADACGGGLTVAWPAIAMIADELDAMAARRLRVHLRPPLFDNLCRVLAAKLRAGAAEKSAGATSTATSDKEPT